MTVTKKAAAAALILGMTGFLTGPAMSADEEKSAFGISGNLVFTTDYLFRGISQTDNDPAVQGIVEFTYTFNDYLVPYVSLWGSNVDFGEPPFGGDRASAEFDLNAGLRGAHGLSERYSLLWDIGVTHYFYPEAADSANYDYVDFGPFVQFKTPWVTPGVGYRFSPDNFGDSGNASYLYGTLNVPVPLTAFTDKYEVGLFGRFGRQWVSRNTVFGVPDYNEWNLGATLTYVPWLLDFSVSYNDTDIDREDCVGGTKLCQSRVVVSMTKRF